VRSLHGPDLISELLALPDLIGIIMLARLIEYAPILGPAAFGLAWYLSGKYFGRGKVPPPDQPKPEDNEENK
jgi:hypothetical protein